MQLAVLDSHKPEFPDPNTALDDPDGLLAVGGNLQPDTLLSAYYQGTFLGITKTIRCFGGHPVFAV